jgi:hypothetical protein
VNKKSEGENGTLHILFIGGVADVKMVIIDDGLGVAEA